MAVKKTDSKLPTFDNGSRYEIKVNKTVQLAEHLWARPSSKKIVVDGETARKLGDIVTSAVKI